MKTTVSFKSIIFGLFIVVFINGCSSEDEILLNNSKESDNVILFSKSPEFDWNHLKVEVSFEDNLEEFKPIESGLISGNKLHYSLTKNNIEQGIIVKIKMLNLQNHLEKTKEIMIEHFDLKSGENEIVIGYTDYKPYIIY